MKEYFGSIKAGTSCIDDEYVNHKHNGDPSILLQFLSENSFLVSLSQLPSLHALIVPGSQTLPLVTIFVGMVTPVLIMGQLGQVFFFTHS